MLADRELMELMVKSGCLGLVIGFESISPQCINDMNKYTNITYSRFFDNEVNDILCLLLCHFA